MATRAMHTALERFLQFQAMQQQLNHCDPGDCTYITGKTNLLVHFSSHSYEDSFPGTSLVAILFPLSLAAEVQSTAHLLFAIQHLPPDTPLGTFVDEHG
jgi:hypothetical protein